jgi:hypothetical protein
MTVQFRDDRQRARVCRALLGTLGLERFWTLDGPIKDQSKSVAGTVNAMVSGLSNGEHALVRAAWDFWNGEGKMSLNAILNTLDAERTQALCTLLVAANQSTDAVDAWIAMHERPSGRSLDHG